MRSIRIATISEDGLFSLDSHCGKKNEYIKPDIYFKAFRISGDITIVSNVNSYASGENEVDPGNDWWD